jgi:hypothetical protein
MKNYSEIIQQLIEINDKLIAGEIKLEVAKQVCTNVQVLINAAKLQLEVLKYQKKSTSEFFKELDMKDNPEPSSESPKAIESKRFINEEWDKTLLDSNKNYRENCGQCQHLFSIASTFPAFIICDKSGSSKKQKVEFKNGVCPNRPAGEDVISSIEPKQDSTPIVQTPHGKQSYEKNCKECAFFVNIIRAKPFMVTCKKSGKNESVLLDFDICKWL